jgi:hypothetical protein
MEPGKPKTLRCATYTRKSSEEGLEQDFNSLHAQREACESFISCATHGDLPDTLLAPERASLLLAAHRGSLVQGHGRACIGLAFEAEQRRVSSAHYQRHHEAHVDPRIAYRFGDRVSRAGRVSPSTRGVETDNGASPAVWRRRYGLVAGNRMHFDGGFGPLTLGSDRP